MIKSIHMGQVIIPTERIENKIFLIRGKKVMLDRDLALLYSVATKVLNQAVKRNSERFPDDFMFQLSPEEGENLKSQIVTSSSAWGGTRYNAFAFTEQGVAMLSSILKSKRAVMVNIQIIRTFTKLREMIGDNESLRRKVEIMEKQYDEQFKVVFDALRKLLTVEDGPKTEIGFQAK